MKSRALVLPHTKLEMFEAPILKIKQGGFEEQLIESHRDSQEDLWSFSVQIHLFVIVINLH